MQPLGLENEEAVPLYLPESFWAAAIQSGLRYDSASTLLLR
jgi:hypothetical protein